MTRDINPLLSIRTKDMKRDMMLIRFHALAFDMCGLKLNAWCWLRFLPAGETKKIPAVPVLDTPWIFQDFHCLRCCSLGAGSTHPLGAFSKGFFWVKRMIEINPCIIEPSSAFLCLAIFAVKVTNDEEEPDSTGRKWIENEFGCHAKWCFQQSQFH